MIDRDEPGKAQRFAMALVALFLLFFGLLAVGLVSYFNEFLSANTPMIDIIDSRGASFFSDSCGSKAFSSTDLWASNGKWIMNVPSEDYRCVRFYDIRGRDKKEPIISFVGPTSCGSITCIDIAQQANLAVCVVGRSSLLLLDIEKSEVLLCKQTNLSIQTISISPDGLYMAAVNNRSVMLMDKSGETIGEFSEEILYGDKKPYSALSGSIPEIMICWMTINRNPYFIAIVARTNTSYQISLWDVLRERRVAILVANDVLNSNAEIHQVSYVRKSDSLCVVSRAKRETSQSDIPGNVFSSFDFSILPYKYVDGSLAQEEGQTLNIVGRVIAISSNTGYVGIFSNGSGPMRYDSENVLSLSTYDVKTGKCVFSVVYGGSDSPGVLYSSFAEHGELLLSLDRIHWFTWWNIADHLPVQTENEGE